MQNKRIFTPYTVYLIVLLAAVLAYFVWFFPQQQTKMQQMETEQELLQMENNALSPYEMRIGEMQQQADALRAQLAADTTLQTADVLSDFVIACAEEASVKIIEFTISEPEDANLAGVDVVVYRARAVAQAPSAAEFQPFLALLETQNGAGLYVERFEIREPKKEEDAFELDAQFTFYTVPLA